MVAEAQVAEQEDGQEVGAVQHRQREQDADLVDEEQREDQHQAGEEVLAGRAACAFIARVPDGSVASRARRAFFLVKRLDRLGELLLHAARVGAARSGTGPDAAAAQRAQRRQRARIAQVAQLLDQHLLLLAALRLLELEHRQADT